MRAAQNVIRTAVLLGVLSFVAFWSSLQAPISGDATTHVYLAYRFVFHGDADLSSYADAPAPFVMNTLSYGEALYSPYVPGNALIYAPFALLLGVLGVPAPSLLAAAILPKALAAALTAASIACTYVALRTVTSHSRSVLVAASCALGTYALSGASQVYFQHPATLALFAAATVLLLRGRYAIAGLPLGLAVAVRPLDLFFAGACLLFVLLRSRRDAVRCALWMLPGLALLATYDAVLFGSPLRLPGAHVDLGSPLEGIAGLLISPSRGLFVYSPQLVLAYAALAASWRWRSNAVSVFLRCGSLAVIASLITYGTYVDWYGGWTYGNRYLADLLPVYAIALGAALERGWVRTIVARLAFWAANAWAVVLHAAGAAVYYFYWRGEHWDATPNIGLTRERLWRWDDTQWEWVLRRIVTDPVPSVFIECVVLLAIVLILLRVARAGGAPEQRPLAGAAARAA